MKCPKCGKEIANNSKFCEFCGAKISKSKNKKHNSLLYIVFATLLVFCIAGGITAIVSHQQKKQRALEAQLHAIKVAKKKAEKKAEEERLKAQEAEKKRIREERNETELRVEKAEKKVTITQVHKDFTEYTFGIGMIMIWVEGGSFLMGCTSEQGNDCESDEKNVRRVTLDGFYIGMLEVTQSQWEKIMGTSIYQQWTKAGYSGSPTRGVGSDYPIYCVSWNEAMDFCRELSRLTGKTYMLPTEAQWEYAARGGTKADGTKYAYAGSNFIDVVGWYDGNSGSNVHQGGTKSANGLNIFDMSGNVWEWCKDWYSSSYTSYDTNNPSGPSSGSYRVVRGGCWGSRARRCRVAHRNNISPNTRYRDLGFRVVCLP